MLEQNDKCAALLQNLRDAGCDETMITCCLSMAETNSEYRMLPLLQDFRSSLLKSIHEGQDKLACLDYLIYQVKKEAEEGGTP